MTTPHFIRFLLLIITVCTCHAKMSYAQETVAPTDSVSVLLDSIVAQSDKSTDLEYPVIYSATDSIVYNIAEKRVYLYGEAEVTYDDINLKAAYIEFGFSDNEVLAYGVPDTSGEIKGKPLFSDGSQEFEASSIRYNFDSKKGLIKDVVTEEAEGFLYSKLTKRHTNEQVHIKDAKYTTCDKEKPHYHFRLSRAVVIPDKKIVSGPGYMVIGRVPTPVGIPFGFFPNKTGGAAGIILPAIGTNPSYGISLLDLGYYFPIKERISQTFYTDIYSRGSWAVRSNTVYRTRYKNQGNLKLSYAQYAIGLKELPTFTKSKEFFVNWSHTLDPKAKPTHSFTATVNAGTSGNFTSSPNASTTDFVQNTFNSRINYGKTFRTSPFIFNVGVGHDQNSINKTHNFTLPDAVLNVNRFNLPTSFLRKTQGGTSRWYEKIGISGTTNMKALLTAQETGLRSDNLDSLLGAVRPGVKHAYRANTSIKAGYLAINPSVNYTERWAWESLQKTYDLDSNVVVTDTVNGFVSGRDYNFSLGTSTKLFGMYNMLFGPIKTIRHVISPNVTFKYFPDLSRQNASYIDQNNNKVQYSAMQGGVFGAPDLSNRALLDFQLVNNLEMKMRNSRDSVSKQNKVSLLDQFTLAANYDLLKDSLNWSTVSMRAQTKLGRWLGVQYEGTIDPYQYTDSGAITKESMWATSRKLGRLVFNQLTLNGGINSSTFKKQSESESEEDETDKVKPKVPYFSDWDIGLRYNFSRTSSFINGVDTAISIQSIGIIGSAAITEKWSVNVNSGYDFMSKKVTLTSIGILRNLHCWELGINIVPFGQAQRITVQFGFVASMLQDVKVERAWQDFNKK